MISLFICVVYFRFPPDSFTTPFPSHVRYDDHDTEYNDNPLYSVGKQKRGAMRSGDSGAGSAPEQTTTSQAGGDDASHNLHGFSMSSDNTTSLAATMELFTQRSEKKRLKKSLKKLSKAQNGIGQSVESNGFQNEGDGEGLRLAMVPAWTMAIGSITSTRSVRSIRSIIERMPAKRLNRLLRNIWQRRRLQSSQSCRE